MNSKFFDASIPKFLLVGAGNTFLSAVIMFVLEDLGYWPSTAIAYVIGAIMNFSLNRKFTFKNKSGITKSAARFTLNVVVCYVLAYVVAKPFGHAVLSTTGVKPIWMERLTKLSGMGFYTVLNYFGQRFFVFQKEK